VRVRFSDYYRFPGISYFDSIPDLFEKFDEFSSSGSAGIVVGSGESGVNLPEERAVEAFVEEQERRVRVWYETAVATILSGPPPISGQEAALPEESLDRTGEGKDDDQFEEATASDSGSKGGDSSDSCIDSCTIQRSSQKYN